MNLKRKDTPESREHWEHAERVTREVEAEIVEMRTRSASATVGWLNSEGPLSTTPDVSFTWSPGVTVVQGGGAVDVDAIAEKHAQRYQWGDDTLHGAIRSAIDEALAARK
jgi:hypothetical protein